MSRQLRGPESSRGRSTARPADPRRASDRSASASESERPRVTVCLFASHPLLRAEFERLLPEDEFRLLAQRFPSQPAEDLGTAAAPRATVYAVEAQGNGTLTQSFVAALVARNAAARILVLGETFREEDAFPLLRLGIKGLLRYAEVSSQLARALREMAGGGFWLPRALLSLFVDASVEASRRPRPLPVTTQLSRREREVVDLLLENLSNKEIATRLAISERTAKFHVSNLLAKFGVKRRADLILLSLDPGTRASRREEK